MKTYMEIILEISAATEQIKDEKLKEIAFRSLLEHSLGNNIINKPANKSTDDSKEVEPMTKVKKKSRSAAAVKPESVRQEVKAAFDDITPNYNGLKPLNSLKQKWEQYLWVLYVGKLKGIDQMTNNEIAYVLGEKFSIGATEKQVNNLTFKVITSHVQKSQIEGIRSWKILIDGINLVKSE